MNKKIWQRTIAPVVVIVTLACLSCSKDKAEKTEKAQMPPEHEKMVAQIAKQIEESRKLAVAQVNGKTITMADLMLRMKQIAPKYLKGGQQMTPEIEQKVKREGLDILIFRELAIQEAVRQGLQVKPEAVNDAIKALKTNTGTDDAYRDYLKMMGLNEDSLRKEIERDQLFDLIAAREIFQRITIDERLLRQTYEKGKNTFASPASFDVDDVVITKGRDESAAMTKAKELVAILRKNNNDFSTLAQDGTFVVRKGTVTQKEYPNIFAAAGRMKEGALSDIIREEDGLHIIKVTQREKARQMTFEEARPLIENDLRMSLSEKRKKLWEQELRKHAKIEIMTTNEAQGQGRKRTKG